MISLVDAYIWCVSYNVGYIVSRVVLSPKIEELSWLGLLLALINALIFIALGPFTTATIVSRYNDRLT